MSQAIFDDIDPDLESGVELADLLNDFKDAVASGFSGTSRPANLQAGGCWIDTTDATTWLFEFFDGTDDITLLSINIDTNTTSITAGGDTFEVKRVSADAVGAIVNLVKNRIATSGQVLLGDIVGEVRYIGRDSSAGDPVVGKLKVVATENMTSSVTGSYLTLEVVPTGANSLVETIRFGGTEVETMVRHKHNSLSLGGQNVSTTATIAQLDASKALAEMTGSTATAIQGINSGQSSKIITIHNRSSAIVTLKHNNAGASAADKLKLPNSKDIALVPDDSIDLYYCTADTRWKVKSGAVRPLDAVVTVAASTATTAIDWSTGLVQRLDLAAHTVVTFSNPVEGAEHTLIIYQNSSNTSPKHFSFDMPTQDPRHGSFQPISAIDLGETVIYKWMYLAGIKPAATGATNQFSLSPTLATAATGIDISADGKTLYVGQTSSPYGAAFDITECRRGGIRPFGLKNITTPATLAAQPLNVGFAKDNKTVFTVGGTSPYVQGWNTNRGIPTTVFPNNADLPAGAGKCLAIAPSGLSVAVGHATTPYITVYPYDGSFTPGKATNPVSLPPGTVTGVAFSPAGDFLTIVSKTTPFIKTWAFSSIYGAGTFGSVVSNPGTLPADGPTGLTGRAVAWRPQGDFIAMCMDTTPFIYVVPFNRSTAAYGTPLTVTNVPAGIATCIAWTPCGQFLLVGCDTSPYFYIYDFSSSLLDTNVTLSANPGSQVNDMAIHPHGELAFLALNGGNFFTYYTLPVKARSYVRVTPVESLGNKF